MNKAYRVEVVEILESGLSKEEAEKLAKRYNDENSFTGCCDLPYAMVVEEDLEDGEEVII
jgi:hypothetical protein